MLDSWDHSRDPYATDTIQLINRHDCHHHVVEMARSHDMPSTPFSQPDIQFIADIAAQPALSTYQTVLFRSMDRDCVLGGVRKALAIAHI
jgi:hypothetical protein